MFSHLLRRWAELHPLGSIYWEHDSLFHGRGVRSSQDIMENGFKIPERPVRGWDYGPAIYLTLDPTWARAYGPKVIEAEVSREAKILDLTQLWLEGVIDHSYERLSLDEIMGLVRRFGVAGVYDGGVVAVFDPSVLTPRGVL